MVSFYTLMLIIVMSINYELQTLNAFYIPTIVIRGGAKDIVSSSSNYVDDTIKDRPLLRKFKQGYKNESVIQKASIAMVKWMINPQKHFHA